MRRAFGAIITLFAAALAAPTSPSNSSKPFLSSRDNMSHNHTSYVPPTDAISIPTSTQNIFDDIISVTPPNAESIELEHMSDDTRFYPDYNDKEVVSHNHFTEPPKIEEPSPNQRSKRQIDDYDAMSEEMYSDPTYERKRRELEDEPYRIDLDIPIDSDTGYTILSDSSSSASTPDFQSTRSPESDPDSLSTQITYVIISEDDSSPNGSVDYMMDRLNYTVSEDNATTLTDIAVTSSGRDTTSTDPSPSSSFSTDSKEERQRVFRAIADTIRARRSVRSDNPRYRRRRSIEDADQSSSSLSSSSQSSSSDIDTQHLSRKDRQIPYYRTDITSYRIGRSVSDSDSDDTEPEDARGLNMQDLSMDGTDLKLLDEVAPLPEYASEFSDLVRPSETYVNGALSPGADPYNARSKRSLSPETVHSEHLDENTSTTDAGLEPTTSTQGLDIITATYPLGVDATKENVSLPEGNFLGPRVYAKGELVQEEQPAVTGIAAPMEKEQTITVLNGSETDNVYSASVGSLPLLIPVVGPTAHPGDEPRIELSLPSGYVPYIIQISPATTKKEDENSQTNATVPLPSSTAAEGATSTAAGETTSPQSDALKFVSNVPTVIVGSATSLTPTTQNEVSSVSTQTYTSTSVPEMLPFASIPTTSNKPLSAIGFPADDAQSTSSLRASDISTSSHSEAIGNAPTTSLAPVTTSEVYPTSENVTELRQSSKDLPIPSEQPEILEQPGVSSSSTSQSSNQQEPTSSQQTEGEESPISVPVSPDSTTEQAVRPDLLTNRPEEKADKYAQELRKLEGDIHQSASSDLKSPDDAIDKYAGLMMSPTSAPIRRNGADTDDATVPPFDWKRTRATKRFSVIPILENNAVVSPNGSFNYSFRSANGIQVQESGYLKKDVPKQSAPGEISANGVAQAVQGSYSYTAPDGRLVSVRYVADENGFRPEGNDLPR